MRRLKTIIFLGLLLTLVSYAFVKPGSLNLKRTPGGEKTNAIKQEYVQDIQNYGSYAFSELKKTGGRFIDHLLDFENYRATGEKKYFNTESESKPKNLESNALEEVNYVRAKDGDTLVVAKQTGEEVTVRLIGIDTPESVHPDEERNMKEGEKASDYTKELLSGYESLWLQYDEEVVDQYGRVLAYVWLSQNVDVSNYNDVSAYMLNAILIRNGYAINKTFWPNVKYEGILLQLRNEAESQQAGLWPDLGRIFE